MNENTTYTSKQRVRLKQDPYRVYYITAVLELQVSGGPLYEMVSEDDDKIGRIQWASDIAEVVKDPEAGEVYVDASHGHDNYFFVQAVSGDVVTCFWTYNDSSLQVSIGEFLSSVESRVG